MNVFNQKTTCRLITLIATLALTGVCNFASTQPSQPSQPNSPPSVKQILKEMDRLQTLNQDVTAKVSILQKNIDQGIKKMESIYFAQNMDDKFLIVMTKPEAEKGNGYLKSGEHFWMYRRNTRTFQHVSRDESIAGSDASASDFESPKYEQQYQANVDENNNEILEHEKLGAIPTYKVNVFSTVPDAAYPFLQIWVRQDNLLPLKIENYSMSKNLISTQYFLKYSKIEKQFIPVKQMVIDNFEKGNKTVWEITDITFKPIDEHVFTKAYLENLSN